MKERRRSPRHQVSWQVYLWLSDDCFLVGRTLEVSSHGMRLSVAQSELSGLVKPGQPVRVQVILGEMEGEFTRAGEVRHVTTGSIGLEIKEDLPLKVMTSTASDAGPPRVSDSGQEGPRKRGDYIKRRGRGLFFLDLIPHLG